MPAKLTPAQSELVAANVGLAYAMMRHLRPTSLMSRDELFSACCLGLVRAAALWVESRGKFSTIARWSMRSEISMEFKAKTRMKRTAPPMKGDVYHAVARDGSHDYEQLDIDVWMAGLSDRERSAVNARLAGKTMAESGAPLGVSGEWARKIMRRAYDRRL